MEEIETMLASDSFGEVGGDWFLLLKLGRQTWDHHHYRDLTAFFLQKQLLHGLDNALKDAQVGEAAPDPSVYDLTSRKTVSLLTTATPGRPLVLNFGSCSWPPFMAKLGQFGKMTAKFSSLADFVTVYISEAHPSEEANFTGNIDIAQHKVRGALKILSWIKIVKICYAYIREIIN